VLFSATGVSAGHKMIEKPCTLLRC